MKVLMNNNNYITRFAPSPTGALHLGNARTFLITWLRARSKGGSILMRMEDLDHPRVKREKIEQAYDDLTWLGLDWDGQIIVQSERAEIYSEEFEKLKSFGKLYKCFCSRSDIQNAQSAPNLGDDLVYSNKCRPQNNLNIAKPESHKGAWRFNIADTSELRYYDNFMGEQKVDLSRSSGDFVICREDDAGTIKISYQLACVIDDYYTGITEVVRADDLVNSTFRQIELYKALGYNIPEFLHLPLVVGEDGRRLAKRHGDSRISCLRKNRVSPKKILGWLGWSCGFCSKGVELDLNELLELFNLDMIPHDKVVVGSDDLKYLGF